MRHQAESNYRWFKRELPSLIERHRGAHALLHECEVDGFYASSMEAIAAGLTKFGEDNFSVELVDDAVEDLGFYSHVGSALHA